MVSLELSLVTTGEVALPPDVPAAVPSFVLSTDTSSQDSLTRHPSSLLLSLNDRFEKTGRLSSMILGSEGGSDSWVFKAPFSCIEMSEMGP